MTEHNCLSCKWCKHLPTLHVCKKPLDYAGFNQICGIVPSEDVTKFCDEWEGEE